MTIGERIQSIRKEQKMKQKELAEKCGCSVISVGRYESGERSPSWETITKFAAAFGMSTSELTAGVEFFGDQCQETDFQHIAALKADTLAKYELLNDLGREKANVYITDLTQIDKYTK